MTEWASGNRFSYTRVFLCHKPDILIPLHCKEKKGNISAVLSPSCLIYYVSFTGITAYNSKTYTRKAFWASSEMLAAGPCSKTRLLWNIRNSPENSRGGLCGVKTSCVLHSLLLWTGVYAVVFPYYRSEMSMRGSIRTKYWEVSFQLWGGGAIETLLKCTWFQSILKDLSYNQLQFLAHQRPVQRNIDLLQVAKKWQFLAAVIVYCLSPCFSRVALRGATSESITVEFTISVWFL